VAYQVNGSRVEWNPAAARLRELTEEMPNASVTEFGNINVKARVDSRSTRSTYLVEDSTNSRGQTISRAEYDRVAAIQDAHITQAHMVVVDGYIGSDPQFRTRARLIMEAANANVAGMQKQLYYPAGADYDPASWEPDTTVIYTPKIVGLSGTGKTTTTFTTQLGSKPAQDDFVALMPGGRVYTTENGCFAKTFGLNPEDEPVIYNATTKPDAYLENVSVDAHGKVDFFDTSYTKNGRTTWPFSYVDPWPADQIPPAQFLLILNRNENILPGVARLDRTQAAAYFMLGETTGTSAGGKDEEGKFRRVPGTNPFFPRDMADMGNRMLELLDSHEVQAFVLNTGRVGAAPQGGDEGAKKVTIPYSSAIVQGIVEGTIEWTEDPDFGYEVSAAVPGVDDIEILQPRRLYARQGRTAEHDAMVARLKRERKEFLGSFPGLDESLVKSMG
jgi:ATP-dependent phosphoenolpyruvate carboxykinase